MRPYRIIAALCVLIGMACGGGDDGGGTPPLDAPEIIDFSPATAAPGETVTITGSNFSTTPGENTVIFTNPVSGTTPTSSTTTQITVVVDKDATNGPISVTTSGGTATSVRNLSVTRGVGDVFVFSGIGANNKLRLPNPTATTQYLVLPHATSSAVQTNINLNYRIKTASAVALTANTAAASAPERPRTHIEANQWFETQRWDDAQRVIDRYGLPSASDGRRAPSGAATAPAAVRQFYVLKTTLGNQDLASSYSHITATLRYTGPKCLVYSDNDTLTGGLASGNFTQANFNTFGQTYDNSIEAKNVSFFGPYSDVDGNGKLIILISPVVNNLEEPACGSGQCNCGFIAGFFNPRDLYGTPPVPAGTTNHAEIIYLLAADPTGFWDCSFPVTETASENLGTIPHEHEHLTSFSQRIFHQGGTTQVTWLEEGMAHMAEDLNGDNSSNAARGRLYRADPGDISLEDNTAPLEQRGGIYLMLRLLVDRYGTGILKQIVQSKCTGRACLQTATGTGFSDLLAEFLAAQYLSGTGLTSDVRFNYSPPLNFTNSGAADYFGSLAPGLHTAGGADVNGDMHRSSGDFHIFTGLLNQESQFQFDEITVGLGLRSVIVRIQ